MRLLDTGLALVRLDRDECLARLRSDCIGRLAVIAGDTPLVFPVNYVVDDDDAIIFRTDPGTKLSLGPRCRASFQIDAFDRVNRTGWSVMATGRLEEVTTFDRNQRHVFDLGVSPWASGEKAARMRLIPDRMTGRELVARPGRL